MYQAGARRFSHRFQLRIASKKRVYQRAPRVSGRGVDGEAGRFVHHYYVLIFVDYSQGQFFRKRLLFQFPGHILYVHRVAVLDFGGRPGRGAVDPDQPILDQTLHLGTGQAG